MNNYRIKQLKHWETVWIAWREPSYFPNYFNSEFQGKVTSNITQLCCVDNMDTLKGDNLKIRVSKQKFRSARNMQNAQFLVQYCCITNLSNVNIVKTRFTSLDSRQAMHDKPRIFWKNFPQERKENTYS